VIAIPTFEDQTMPTRMNNPFLAARHLIAAAAATGALFLGLPALAHASDASEVPVHYNPSALKTDAGAKAVYAQIKRAARQACGQPGSRSLQALGAIQQCRQQAVARAVEQIDSPRLAAVHARDRGADRVASAGDLRTSR
jgi:UrcA family protein